MGKWQTKDQLTKLLCNLVRIPSITGSQAEEIFPDFVVQQLSDLFYFQQYPSHLQKNPTGDDRFFITALVKKAPDVKNTVILVSHFDVVDIKDYGRWKEDAFNPEKLTSMFYSHIDELPVPVRQDMEQGNWLFGRGTMDMKCGLALHMSMIEQACEGKFDGNILLLAVPDEEVNSVGMRAAVPKLLDIAKQYDLEYTTVLNSEPMFTRYPGDESKYIYTGSVGKVLPGFLCYGKESHVGEPFAGLNANYMASLLTAEIELNTEFCEIIEGEATPPPTNLIQRDLKDEYSTQIPHRAVTLFNLFLLEKQMEDVVLLLREKAIKVAAQLEDNYMKQANHFSTYNSFTPKNLKVNILTYEELIEYCVQNYGQEQINNLQTSVLKNRNGKDDRDLTIEFVDQLSTLCKELGPMIVIFFAPPYYPAVSSRQNLLIQDVVCNMEKYAYENHNVTFKKQNYFGGISDLSYVGLQYPPESMKPLTTNMPLWNNGYSVPLDELERFNVPVLNVGPVGKDAHQWTERLDIDYAFGTLLDMLPVCIHKLLNPVLERK
ncbi:M20/M25/M40 family metallo-hydrolase [Priestia megaterium]|uniref:M20/M25/M40 family metallo-hydrolase n=1 Tax=Priestia megaterium TaxID=1404 RepID=UPI0027312C2B|nr:M20/M25/M40 family metallo-hydrolase [Priestia megaterium]MDP1442131.1 M20/M25/M40 family metallo-hydrolase [Priestia megaterium]MDP1471092.1 M20/M25/M40 family metallo-hydrolase [Priestia megaterium]